MGEPVLGWALESWALLLLLLGLLMLYGIWPYNFFKKLGIPGPRPLPFIGTFLEHWNDVLKFDQRCFEKYGKIWGIFDGRQPVMAILDPALIKTILVKEFYTYFTNRRDLGLNGNLDTIIAVVLDEQWKRIRGALSPTFTSGRLKEMMPIINHYNEILEKNIQKKVEKGETIDMKLFFSAYSLDVVTSTSFSVNIDSLNHPDDPVVVHMKKFLSFSRLNPLLILVVLFPFLIPVLKKFKLAIFPKSSIDFFLEILKKMKEDRQKKDHTNRVDFLQLMMDVQAAAIASGDSEKALTDNEILAQSFFFIFGGYETTGTSLSFMSYCLATHPDVQEKLYQEINDTFPNLTPPTYDAIHQMEYLDMVVNEAFRLYPPGTRLERICKKTVEIHGMTIPQGTVVMIPAFVLHRIPEYWPEPEEYRPERFSKENKESLDPYVFLPFGAGPRNCVAMRFALLVLKMGLVVSLQRFRFQTCKETPIPLELEDKGFLRTKKPIMLKLVPRVIVKHEE
ncbi:cytochrome P450 3A24-like isoform X1 [Pantherophis guttatus]|uniref:Cytochrome P450 3A n=1 Tax=Pantherophis guttatus TaxID=94885 RepID=A0ABM3YV43_PANGU|nr:cytochrome P450 3A24-like isoform X1 [Pantherophis guttatus]